jgi:two-component system phosphate regulon sensor histidine kinase PhoR
MGWLVGLLPRIFAVLLVLLLGSVMGFSVGASFNFPWQGLLGGAALGSVCLHLSDAFFAYGLDKWLRSPSTRTMPRLWGFWRILGYRAERAVRVQKAIVVAERARLSQLFNAIEASPNGMLLLDADDHIDWCNSMAASHFGLNPVRDRHQPVTNLVRAPLFVAHLQLKCFDEPVVFSNPRDRGVLSVSIRPYGDGMKLVMSQDITVRERHETMQRHFVANVSHEIRTPLTVLIGALESLENLSLNDDERKSLLSMMGQQVTRMRDLVGDLLTLARLDGSPRPSTDHWISLQILLESSVADAQALSKGKHHIELQAGALPIQVEIAGDESEIFSALSNLCVNAVRYTPQGGCIQLCWHMQKDGSGHLQVIDTGIGIDALHLPHLTERFYRVDNSRSRDTGGTGLGLSIVNHVIQRHGGELKIDSVPHQGSVFTLCFPAARIRVVRRGMGS